ncbi:MAG: fibronectin type III domain-containing protein [Fimbriimonadales bacterium]|nr:fibronectin type III domain-containing protein [Fimbriimonadales bacterium]
MLGWSVAFGAPQGDGGVLHDPMRPVMEIGRDYVVLQYHTRMPTGTRVQIRAGNLPMTAWRPPEKRTDVWASKGVRIVEGPPGKRTYHRIRITGLQPGTRYYYRIYDPDYQPTREERRWGARPPWRREYAVATLAPRGHKTIIRLPVKVLLMPNVVNVASAYADSSHPAPPPPKMSEAQLQRIKEEYAIAARYFWVNSGMRLWVDFHIYIDDRWQRWGEEPKQATGFYKGLPQCRAYAGVDFAGPGGGAFTIVDTRDITRTNHAPVDEEQPYAGQIEQAFPRRWNPTTRQWEFYDSGGGTLGVDDFPDGVPARSQFLGGGDTAWLVAHEFHHQMESMGAFSLANREDERIVFNHPEPRYRRVNPDGSVSMNPWNTAGKHGEHWNVMAYWDRTVSDAQWLRFYFGEALVVRDADEDGFPDDDPRLPLDEKRFGSSPHHAQTDGQMNDLRKAMLSTWAPAPLQNTFVKPRWQSRVPNPRKTDQDDDGLPDTTDPYPLYPWQPFVWHARATVDGDPSEWQHIPPAGELQQDDLKLTFKHCHDEDEYYALFEITGDWDRLYAGFDGEGQGVFATDKVIWFEARNRGQVEAHTPWRTVPELQWKASRRRDRTTVIELSIPNGGKSRWFWRGGGREIGVYADVYQANGRGYSLYEPYDVFYCLMKEPIGVLPMPAGAPAELSREAATRVFTPASADGLQIGAGWEVRQGAWAYDGHQESHLRIAGLNATEFDLWVELEAVQDGVLAAFLPTTKETEMNAGRDYVLFVGGYLNTRTRFRLFGAETGESEQMMTPGRHTLQLSRRDGKLWALYDGKPILYARDPNPDQPIGTLALIGGYSGKQRVYEIRARWK